MKKLSLYVFLVLMFCNTSFAEVIKIDCQLSETPGLELPSEDLILLKQRTKPTFKINLDSKEVIAFNYGHSNKNNVKIGMVKISDSEKIVWDKEPYKANLVTYHRMTYHKNEKKLLEESIMTKNFETMKEIIEKGKTNDFFIRNEYIYKCKLVESQSSSSSSVSSNNDQAKRKELIDKMINEYHIVEKIEIPGSLPRVWVTPQFHLLTFSDKKTFIHLIYSYYYTKNPKYDIIKIFDNITGKSIGTYTPSLGLRIKY